MQIISNGDNLHEMSTPVFLEKYFNMSAADFTQSATSLKTTMVYFQYAIHTQHKEGNREQNG